jgi:hypothetical protein
VATEETPLAHIHSECDRSAESMTFIAAILATCRKYGFSIGYEPPEGDFLVYPMTGDLLESNLWWFDSAKEVVYKPNRFDDPEDVRPTNPF